MHIVISKGAGFSLSAKAMAFLVENNCPYLNCREGLDDPPYSYNFLLQNDLSNENVEVYYDDYSEILKVKSRNEEKVYFFSYPMGNVEFRSDKVLLEVVKQLGKLACGSYTELLKILEIPDDVEFELCEANNGDEFIREKSRVWE